jgi:predicted nucleic acid-binding protein
MTRYVIDAPTLLHLVGNEIAVNPEHQLVAPNLLRSEAMHLLLQAVRRGELRESQALEQHERLTELKIRLLGDRVSRRTAFKIALDQGWPTTYGAEYLAVTRLQADALVTVDSQFARQVANIVPVQPVEVLAAG